MMRFHSLAKRPRHFHAFTGYTVEEYQQLVETIQTDWQECRQQSFKQERLRSIGGGRHLTLLSLEDRLLVFILYAKLYPTYLFLEYLLGVDESTICRIIQELSMVLGKTIIVRRSGKRIRTLDDLRQVIPDLDEVLLDATEQKIPRPQKKRSRKKHHSGKKKAFTLKTQILTDKKGIILHVADASPGRVHDYKYFQRTDVPQWLEANPQITGYGDSGYQGVAKDYPGANICIPVKRSRAKNKLTRSEKIMNTKQRRVRVAVEHTFASVKKYRILADVYRNAKEHYSATFKSICFLSNFRTLARMS